MPDEISKSEKNRGNAKIFAWPNKFNPHQIELELDARKVEFQKGEDFMICQTFWSTNKPR